MEVDYRKPRHLHVQVYVYISYVYMAEYIGQSTTEPQASCRASRASRKRATNRASSRKYVLHRIRLHGYYGLLTPLLGYCFDLIGITATRFEDLAITTARTKARADDQLPTKKARSQSTQL